MLRSIINASCLETAATTASPDFEPLTEAMLVTTVSCNSAQSSNETESTDTMRPVGYRTQDPVRLINAYGWSTHDPIKEFNRMSIPDAYWKLSILNSESYSLCDTYPAVVSVPISIDDATLELSAHFRSRNRFPALSWRHPTNKTSLTRCSQPLVGIGQKRSAEDEAMLQLINSARGFEATYESDMLSSRRDAAATSAPASKKGSYEFKKPLMIMDARPKINAQANQAAGKGFELPKAYQNTSIIFLEIANIHAVRSSLESLEELCCNDAGSEGSWLKNVETTGWLMHIRKILSGASRIVHCMDQEELSGLIIILFPITD